MRVGILGTLVWDRIEHPDAPVVERWGGIAYSLAAAAAALPSAWSLRPLIRVGADLAQQATSLFERLPSLDRSGVVTVPEPNNRVHLRYLDRQNRHECLTGGVSGWRWEELEPRLEGLDALFVNLIAGNELDLELAERLRGALDGPTYCDLHSLLLGHADHGHRPPRPLDHPDRWLAAFDVVQVNRDELALAAGDGREPWRVAERAVARGLTAVLVTDGADGAVWVSASGDLRPFAENGRRSVSGAEPRRGDVPVAEPQSGDPTGCGDVWGATCFIRLLQGDTLIDAMAAANHAAATNVLHRGAEQLYRHLGAEA